MHISFDVSDVGNPALRGTEIKQPGKVEESLPYFKKIFKQNPIWKELINRLPNSGLLPDDKVLIKKILSAG